MSAISSPALADPKKCPRCGEAKPLNSFSPDRSEKDGLRFWCKPCVAEYARNRRKEKPEQHRAKDAEYYEKNREYLKLRFKKWRTKNVEHAREQAKKWKLNHPGHDALKSRRGRQKLSDSYVRKTLVAMLGLKSHSEVPEYLIQIKREQLEVCRLARKLRKEAREAVSNAR